MSEKHSKPSTDYVTETYIIRKKKLISFYKQSSYVLSNDNNNNNINNNKNIINLKKKNKNKLKQQVVNYIHKYIYFSMIFRVDYFQ